MTSKNLSINVFRPICLYSAIALCVYPAYAQSPPGNSLRDQMYELNDASTARGDSWEAKAELFVEWMATKDWRSMDLEDLYNLYGFVNADSVDRCRFSARWTGSLTAPVSGAYTLRQVPVYLGANSRLKVLVNGQSVLDSSNPSSETAFRSSPIQLGAGEAVPLAVDLVHNGPYINFSEGAPMVVLTWQRSGANEVIIPPTAFRPPVGFAGAHGLKGEYFRTTTHEDLRVTRLDPALDLVWSWPPAASIHSDEARQIFDACTAKILNGDFLSQSVTEGELGVLEHNLWRVAFRMTAAQRQQLVATLLQRPDVLRAMKPLVMGKLMQAIYLLPGDEHLELLGRWSLARPQPRCEAGEFPGWGDGFYQQLNTDYYWLMGRFLQGPYAGDMETLCDQYLVRPDGECNLAVAYAAAYASRLNGNNDRFLARLDEHINDPAVSGDKLVTWLIARAFAQGALPGNPQPMTGFSDLESAYISADTADYKFWALQEMVARLSSTDKGERAKALIQENLGRFTSPQQQEAMAQWIAKADSLATHYVEERAAHAQASRTGYVTELEQRRQSAVARGDLAAAARYAQLIESAQSSLGQ